MKILGMAAGGIVVIVVISITIISFSDYDQINHDKIRVAFFPSIGHIIPIVGLEEKPTHRSIVNAGIYVLDPKVLEFLKEDVVDEVRRFCKMKVAKDLSSNKIIGIKGMCTGFRSAVAVVRQGALGCCKDRLVKAYYRTGRR